VTSIPVFVRIQQSPQAARREMALKETTRKAGRGEYGPTNSRSKVEDLVHDQKRVAQYADRNAQTQLCLQLLDERVGQCTTECESGLRRTPRRGSSIAGISIGSGVVPSTIASRLEIRIIFASGRQNIGLVTRYKVSRLPNSLQNSCDTRAIAAFKKPPAIKRLFSCPERG
jgi:hypothetical protein